MPTDGGSASEQEQWLRHRVKAELRKRMRGLRTTLPASACAERSERIIERLLALDAVARARAVGLFWPIVERHEVDLRALDARLRERGVRVAYPAVRPQTPTMDFRFVLVPQAMDRGRVWSGVALYEPSETDAEASPGELDVIVVPALGADPAGQRIGYGAGHYDATLPRFAPPATTIVVVFDFQLLAEVPATEADIGADWVVTDVRTLQASRR